MARSTDITHVEVDGVVVAATRKIEITERKHTLTRRKSDWSVVCSTCRAEFWAAGSDVESTCPGGTAR